MTRGQGPSGPSERGGQGPSGPSERGGQGPSGPSERGGRLARVLWLAMAIDVILLAATGAGLTVNYRPEVAPAGPAGAPITLRPGGGPLGDAHRWLAVAATLLVAALAVLAVARARRRPRTQAVVTTFLLVAAGAVAAAWVSGDRLPWTQLALYAVPARPFIGGVWHAAFNPLVVFVVVGGDEIGRSEYRTRVVLHLFAAPALLVVALAGARLHSRHRA